MSYLTIEYISFTILGVLPSLIWLFYFLDKDNDPEPKIRILLVFIFGVLGAFLAASIQAPTREFLHSVSTEGGRNLSIFISFVDSFFAVAFLEETVKLLAVLLGVFLLGVRELDEPVDFIIYMITAGLGFAALENYIYFSRVPTEMIAELVLLRFAITTLFHAIVAGILGYFMALSIRVMKPLFIFLGLIVVTFFHTLYNVLIEFMAISENIIYPIFLLLFLLVLTMLLLRGFKETKRMKGICEINL